jgi:hypothetical protein
MSWSVEEVAAGVKVQEGASMWPCVSTDAAVAARTGSPPGAAGRACGRGDGTVEALCRRWCRHASSQVRVGGAVVEPGREDESAALTTSNTP